MENFNYKKYVSNNPLLKESEEDDMMSPEEIKNELIQKIAHYRRTVNEWSTRDILKRFTSWEFWSGHEMVAIDIDMAIDIVNELRDYVTNLDPESSELEMIYNELQ